jgi:hypothetical protein
MKARSLRIRLTLMETVLTEIDFRGHPTMTTLQDTLAMALDTKVGLRAGSSDLVTMIANPTITAVE